VEAHATATPLGDPIEIQGLKLAFSTATQNSTCALGSIKSNIGHLNAAAGIAGLVKTVLTLKHKVLFPQAGFQSLNPEIQFEGSPFFVSTKYQAWESESTRIAGISAFGVGGTNVHLVLSEEKTETETEKFSDKLPGYLLPLSAKSEESLLAYTKKLIKHISSETELAISSIAQALYQRPSGAFRQYLVVKDKNDLLDQLQHFPETLPLAKTKKKPVFLFPGQGAQFINMGKSLYDHFSIFKEAVDECESILMDQEGFSIKSLIFSHAPNALDEEKLKLKMAARKEAKAGSTKEKKKSKFQERLEQMQKAQLEAKNRKK
jgi:acyl transferase domain-containing protein